MRFKQIHEKYIFLNRVLFVQCCLDSGISMQFQNVNLDKQNRVFVGSPKVRW